MYVLHTRASESAAGDLWQLALSHWASNNNHTASVKEEPRLRQLRAAAPLTAWGGGNWNGSLTQQEKKALQLAGLAGKLIPWDQLSQSLSHDRRSHLRGRRRRKQPDPDPEAAAAAAATLNGGGRREEEGTFDEERKQRRRRRG